MTIHVTPTGENVFENLGFDPETAKNLKLRTDLMRGEIDAFTIDSLVNMLSHAGVDVELRLDRTG